nr:sialidase family protein [Micromonospora sp. DSM 115978]
MPEVPGDRLDAQLGRARTTLLDGIAQPPLATIRHRAARRRRHRRAGGVALVALALAATMPAWPWPDHPAPPPATDPTPTAPVYADAGITITGLDGTDVPMLPGRIAGVEFVDPTTGYVLSACPVARPCPVTVAGTGDGGATWRPVELPADTAGWAAPELVAFPDGSLIAYAGPAGGGSLAAPGGGAPAGGYLSTDDGRTWRPAVGPDPAPPATPVRAGDLLRLRAGERPCAGALEVWRAGRLPAGQPVRQPDLDVCWVAPTPAADGAWWVGGVRDGTPAVAVTRDGGANWQSTILTVGPVDVQVTSVELVGLGRHLYASALGPDRTLLAVFHSADGGASFTRTFDGRVAGFPAVAPTTALAGALVPLLDGRLLATGADQRWYVSADDGRGFARAEGNLPAVGRLARTHAGFVAYELFGAGWAAYSPDGTTWRKLQIN